MLLSLVIPARNEEGCLEGTLRALHDELNREKIAHEIYVVDDGSTDATPQILTQLAAEIPALRFHTNGAPHGFGYAIRAGLDRARGELLCVYMADASDRPSDVVRFFRHQQKTQVDCVFGTRFHKESRVFDYPKLKYVLNRAANTFIQLLFGLRYNDVTNAFKMYHRRAIDGARPMLSAHFNLTVELPLKSIIRGFSYDVLPNDWINRKTGESKLKIKEMGSRYLFIVLYCFIEKWLSRGDYLPASTARPDRRAA